MKEATGSIKNYFHISGRIPRQSRIDFSSMIKRCSVLCLIAATYQFSLMHLQYTTENYWFHLADVLVALNDELMAKNYILNSYGALLSW